MKLMSAVESGSLIAKLKSDGPVLFQVIDFFRVSDIVLQDPECLSLKTL